jgi:hypothetical protein|tara:strand:+ start:329 stop:508 length:180 start_codon:yes stop_codon:yes gene_type:complete
MVTCPKCLGAEEIMEPKVDKGFEYKDCSLCRGSGVVTDILEEDFILSLNEDNMETNDDW